MRCMHSHEAAATPATAAAGYGPVHAHRGRQFQGTDSEFDRLVRGEIEDWRSTLPLNGQAHTCPSPASGQPNTLPDGWRMLSEVPDQGPKRTFLVRRESGGYLLVRHRANQHYQVLSVIFAARDLVSLIEDPARRPTGPLSDALKAVVRGLFTSSVPCDAAEGTLVDLGAPFSVAPMSLR